MAIEPSATQMRLPAQTDPPRSPRQTLPTMYDLPSEDPEEPGLPDEFHDYQPPLRKGRHSRFWTVCRWASSQWRN